MKDWNLMTIEEHIEHLKKEFLFNSSGTAKSVYELIKAYEAKNLNQAAVSGSLPRRCSYADCPDTAVHCGRTDCGRNIGHIRQ